MKSLRLLIGAALALATPGMAPARDADVAANFSHAIPNIPGKSLIALVVTYPPGGASTPHHHAKSAFIYGYVLSGVIQSQVEGEPAKTLTAGESFYEPPGAHHVVSRNMSATQPAKLLAVFVVDTDDTPLTTADKQALESYRSLR
jgi:quercetin dioxygenase-like cupin family protein